MVSLLRLAWQEKALHRAESAQEVDRVLNQLMAKPWVIFSRHSGGQADTIIDYLSRYTHRIAISGQRLIKMDDEKVKFQ